MLVHSFSQSHLWFDDYRAFADLLGCSVAVNEISHVGVRSGIMEGRGNVVVISTDGRKLETPQLRFDPGRNEISSDSSFVMTTPTDIVTGIGFLGAGVIIKDG